MSGKREHNADELEPPKWLDVEFFTKVLRGSEKDETISVENIEITPATFKGDHFGSVMFRARLLYRQEKHGNTLQTKSTITKMMPEIEGVKMDLLKETQLFQTEIAMYENVMPNFEAILKEAGDGTTLSPRCLYTSLKPHQLIVFEDTVAEGYIVLRDRDINLDEVRIALQKLAKWHAVGLKVSTEDPNYVATYSRSIFTVREICDSPLMREGLDQFIEMLSETPGLQQYECHLRNIKINLFEKSKSYSLEYFGNRRKGTTYVLCHGDFHLKNLMFRQKPFDVKLLDFQLSAMGPIALDVIYATLLLFTPEQRRNHRDELYFFYYTQFINTLKAIAFEGEIPKLSDFRAQLLHYRYFELHLLVTFLPMFYAVILDDGDPGKIFSSNEYRKLMYRHVAYIDEMKTLLPYYLHLGYFEE